MKNRFTNSDRMLQRVLSDEKLIDYGEYDLNTYETVEQALSSENAYVVAVAKIITGHRSSMTEKEIYNEVSNYLKSNLI